MNEICAKSMLGCKNSKIKKICENFGRVYFVLTNRLNLKCLTKSLFYRNFDSLARNKKNENGKNIPTTTVAVYSNNKMARHQ